MRAAFRFYLAGNPFSAKAGRVGLLPREALRPGQGVESITAAPSTRRMPGDFLARDKALSTGERSDCAGAKMKQLGLNLIKFAQSSHTGAPKIEPGRHHVLYAKFSIEPNLVLTI